VTGRHADRHCTGVLGGVDVAGRVADNEDLVGSELVMQTRGLGDAETRELPRSAESEPYAPKRKNG